MNNVRRFGALSSSVNPDELATKVKGGILMASAVIIYLAAKLFGFTLSSSDMVGFATEGGALAGAVWTIYGIVQHIVVRLAEKK